MPTIRNMAASALLLALAGIMPAPAQNLDLVSSVGGSSYAQAYVLIGGKPHLAAAIGGQIAVFDASDPKAPVAVGRLQVPSNIRALAAHGTTLYAGSLSPGLQAIDLSDPAKPRIAKSIASAATHLVVAGGILYAGYSASFFADGAMRSRTGLTAYSLSDPLAPAKRGYLEVPGIETDFAVRGEYAYHPAGKWLQVIRVADPDSLALIDSSTLLTLSPVTTEFQGIHIVDTVAYIPTRTFGLVMASLAIPEMPLARGAVGGQYYQGGTAVIGKYLYAAHISGVDVFDLSDPIRPFKADTLRLSAPQRLAAWDSTLLVAQPGTALRFYDASDPRKPAPAGVILEPSSILALALSGNRLAAADTRRFSAFDLSNPAAPAHVLSMGDYGTSWRVAADTRRAYLLGEGQMAVFDMTASGAPGYLSRFDSTGWGKDLLLRDTAVFIADNRGFLRSASVAGSAPRLLQTLKTGAAALAIASWERKLLVARSDSSVLVVEASDPSAMAPVDSFRLKGKPERITANDSLALVSLGYAGLEIFRLRAGSAPLSVALHKMPNGMTRHADLHQTHAFVAHYSVGVEVLDLTDPSSPKQHGTYRTAGTAYECHWNAREGLLYVADGSLLTFKVNGLQTPVSLARRGKQERKIPAALHFGAPRSQGAWRSLDGRLRTGRAFGKFVLRPGPE